MKKNKENRVASVVKKMVTSMIDGDAREWPPTCSILIYQPSRPNRTAVMEAAIGSEKCHNNEEK